MVNLGDRALASTLSFLFNTHKADGTPITLAGTPVVSVYKNSTTQSTSGVTLTVGYDGLTGMHQVIIDTSLDGAFYATGNDFNVVITTGTVDSISVVGAVVGKFSIGRQNISHMNSIAASSVTTINANQGQTQPVNFTGTGASAYVKTDIISAAGTAWGSGAITDGVFGASTYPRAIRTNSTNGAAAGYVDLDGSASAVDNFYVGCSIKITAGDGAGQSRTIILYVGSTKRAYIDRVWATNPVSATYLVNAGKLTLDVLNTGVAAAGGASTITLASSAVATNEYYDGAKVQIISGTGLGQSRIISGYVGSTRVATVTDAWATQPDNTSVYAVMGLGDVEVGVNNDKTGYALASTAVNVTAIDGQATNGNNATLNLKKLNIVNDSGDAIVASSTGANGDGIKASGNGSGNGMHAVAGDTGNGIRALGGATSGNGLRAWAPTSGDGISAEGEGTGSGMYLWGGDTHGDGLTALGGPNGGCGIVCGSAGDGKGLLCVGNGAGAGILAQGGVTGDGFKAKSGATSGNGIQAEGTGASGNGIKTTGSQQGNGIDAEGGATTGNGIIATGGANADGIIAVGGATSGNGITAQGGLASGIGLLSIAPAGMGLCAQSGGNNPGFQAISGGDAPGFQAICAGTDGNGIEATGKGTTGSGIVLTKGGASGHDMVLTDNPTAMTQLSKSASTIADGTVDNTGFAPTTTQFECSDITSAAVDYYFDRTVVFKTGALAKQARRIVAYSLVGGRGHFTVEALTAAPANGVVMVIV